MKKHLLLTAILAFSALSGAFAQRISGTYMYARRDTCRLFMDVYNPTPGADTKLEGHDLPTLLFVYGGGFIGGYRSNHRYMPWCRILNDNGYKVITIDYRLGLKGVKMDFSLKGKMQTARNTIKAEYMGVEDLFSAVNYIISNKEALGVDPDNIVLVGNSSGAIISLAAELSICNGDAYAAVLPKGFNFKGLISFAGAIVGDSGVPKYKSAPCPTLLLHGTADRTVQYDKTQVFKLGMWGTNILDDIYRKNGYPFCVYRFHDHAHDIADNFVPLWPFQKYFLEQNVILGRNVFIDAYIDDPNIPKWEAATLDSLY